MRVDFIKEVQNDGQIIYYTNIDGNYANNSLSSDSEKAMDAYESIIARKPKSETIVIRTTIIDDAN